MAKYYKGDVIEVVAFAGLDKDGNKKFKLRPVVVLYNTNKSSDAISVYCTSQNDGKDHENILVTVDSKDGIDMGIDRDTYIRPRKILNIPIDSVNRRLGKCNLMQEIAAIMDKIRAQG